MKKIKEPGISPTKTEQYKDTNGYRVTKGDCILVSLVVLNDEGRGHHYTYAEAVGRSASLLGWTHLAAISKEYEKAIPANWSSSLSCRNLITLAEEKNQDSFISRLARLIFGNVSASYNLASSITSYLREITHKYPTGNIILLIDSFFSNEILALIYSLIFFKDKKRLYVWCLYRYELTQQRLFFYRLLNQILEFTIPHYRIKLLTDSETLKEYLSASFNRVFNVVPIPHTTEDCTEKFTINSSEILAWWPGGPRANKGLAILQTLANTVCDQPSNICIVAASSSNLQQVVGGPRIELIEDVLSREEYIKWLYKVDIILLPYDPLVYRLQTSGIFTECVCAGKIPLVREGTWMASELQRHGLESLIVDWESPEIFSIMIEIANNPVIREKLARLQDYYISYHSERGYAETMKKLMDGTL